MRYTIILAFLLSSFNIERFQVAGYLDDVSPNGQYILYEAPLVWEPGEYRLGNLCVLDVKTGGITIVQDYILVDECKSFFLDEFTIAMNVGKGRIERYDLRTKTLEKDPLLAGNERDITLQLAFNHDRTKVALVLLNMTKRLPNKDGASETTYKVALKVVDLQTGKQYTDEHYDYGSGKDIHQGKILWHGNDDVIYAYQNSCYCYNLIQQKSFLLSSHGASIALYQDDLILSDNFSSKKFDLNKSIITELPQKYSEMYKYPVHAWSKWYTIRDHGINRAALRVDEQHKYDFYIIDDNYQLIPTDKLLLYQDQAISIQLLLSSIPCEGHQLTKEELLISYNKG